jgi:hypothetical protein
MTVDWCRYAETTVAIVADATEMLSRVQKTRSARVLSLEDHPRATDYACIR